MSKQKTCKIRDCDTQPSFNEPGKKGGLYCGDHAFHLKNPTNVVSIMCMHNRRKADCTEGDCRGKKRVMKRCEPHNTVLGNCIPCRGINVCVFCNGCLGNPKYLTPDGRKRCADCFKAMAKEEEKKRYIAEQLNATTQ